MSAGRGLALAALPLGVTLALNLIAGRAAAPPDLKAARPALTCTRPTTFSPGYQRREDYVVPQGEGFKFRSEAWLQADVCSAGQLTITASGELAGDELPQLTVALGTEVLAAPRFDRERTITIRIPQPGRIVLGYFNDYYLADVRVATLNNIKLTSPKCQGFKSVEVPRESGGNWSPEARVASLVRGPPMTLVPCAAGALTMRAQGREGDDAFPVLVFSQGGRIIKTLPTDLTWQDVRLPLTAAPFTITVGNPYGVTLGDRNLDVRRLTFTPDARP